MGLRRAVYEQYVPEADGNRARYQAGDPTAYTVALRRPSHGVMMRYRTALLEKRIAVARAQGIDLDQAAVPRLDNDVEGPLFTWCVGAFTPPLAVASGEPIASGAALWAIREDLEEDPLFEELLTAVFARGVLEAGLAGFLGSSRVSTPATPEPSGTVGTAGLADSRLLVTATTAPDGTPRTL